MTTKHKTAARIVRDITAVEGKESGDAVLFAFSRYFAADVKFDDAEFRRACKETP